MGINAVRNQVGNSNMGKQFLKNQFQEGVMKGPVNPVVSNLTDLVVSPAALDMRRLGDAIGNQEVTPQAARALKSLVGTNALTPNMRTQIIGALNAQKPELGTNINQAIQAIPKGSIGGVVQKANKFVADAPVQTATNSLKKPTIRNYARTVNNLASPAPA
jgi:hypothetical protein